ncbi:hypothetical protein [Methylobacterium sp. W2]|uniref:hypothetical protein n=1 Tax=Methylobacterium sp. W2 TaxID=2598107 RepID=UPI001D0C0F8B|nr:hypothetical protein [Methylobacterium sp. W2]
MKNPTLSAMAKTLAIVVALVGAMILGTPRGVQAAPMAVSSEVAGSVNVAATQVQYGGGHWRHHGRHHRRHFGHHRGRHFGHHYGRRFGHHHHHRRFGHHHRRHYRY